ncbi:hypothetical protein BJ742DRAFT_363164 [Cladochytrium replicatum]|nr:hypothetical protein BJ742DRAFT_363164 [Cladochytrium replicatum]
MENPLTAPTCSLMETPDQSPQLSSAQLTIHPSTLHGPPQSFNNMDGTSLLTIFPREFAFHVARSNKGMIARTLLTNRSSERTVGFKFKTNAPGRFSVSPVLGIVYPQSSVEIYVRSQSAEFMPSDSFMVETVDLNISEVSTLTPLTWRELPTSRILSVYLSCRPPTPYLGPPQHSSITYFSGQPLISAPLPQPISKSDDLHAKHQKSDPKSHSWPIQLAPLVLLRVLVYAFLMWIFRMLFWPVVVGRLENVVTFICRIGNIGH